MRDYPAPKGSRLHLEVGTDRVTVDLYSQEAFDLLSTLTLKVGAELKVNYEPTWLGRPIIQFANDVVAIQELLWRVKPDLVIETGVAHGGSLVLSASILELLGEGSVLGIDLEIRPHNREALEKHPLIHRIKLLEGSSIAPEILEKVRAQAKNARRVMVILDSNHSTAHVAQELALYSPLVTLGSYIIAHDGAQAWVSDIPRGKPEWKTDHPLAAIDAFVAEHPEFQIDESCTRLGVTSSPRGYLKRVAN